MSDQEKRIEELEAEVERVKAMVIEQTKYSLTLDDALKKKQSEAERLGERVKELEAALSESQAEARGLDAAYCRVMDRERQSSSDAERLRKAIEEARQALGPQLGCCIEGPNCTRPICVADRVLSTALTPSPAASDAFGAAAEIEANTPIASAPAAESGLIRSLPSVVMTVEAYNQMEHKARRLDSINELMQGGNALLVHPGKNLVTYTIIAEDQMPKVLEALADPTPPQESKGGDA